MYDGPLSLLTYRLTLINPEKKRGNTAQGTQKGTSIKTW